MHTNIFFINKTTFSLFFHKETNNPKQKSFVTVFYKKSILAKELIMSYNRIEYTYIVKDNSLLPPISPNKFLHVQLLTMQSMLAKQQQQQQLESSIKLKMQQFVWFFFNKQTFIWSVMITFNNMLALLMLLLLQRFFPIYFLNA